MVRIVLKLYFARITLDPNASYVFVICRRFLGDELQIVLPFLWDATTT
jgi:hypothetical protein